MSWQEQAACKGLTRLFFDDGLTKSDPEKNAEAKRICNNSCPVKEDCLEFAITHRMFDGGVWGGLDSAQVQSEYRRRIRVRAALKKRVANE